MSFPRWMGAVLAAGIAGAVLPAAATPLPAPFVLGEVFFNTEPLRTSIAGFGALDHALDSHGTLHFDATGEPLPSMTATADLHPLGIGSGTADGTVRYSFEIVGAPGALVPVVASAKGHVSGFADASAGFSAISRWSLRTTSEIDLLQDSLQISSSGGGTDSQDFDQSHLVMLQTNTEYRVVMEAKAQAGTLDLGMLALAEAFIDPWFAFGDGVDASLFSFHFSDGIGNTPPTVGSSVPEPGGPACVLLALGALALTRRVRPAGR